MLTGLLHCHGIDLLVPEVFPPVGFSMQLPVVSETLSSIPISLLVFEGNIFIPLLLYTHEMWDGAKLLGS